MTFKLNHKESQTKNEDRSFYLADNLFKIASNGYGDYILPEYTPISNQGSLGSCVANSTTDCLEILKGIEDKNSVVQYSRLFVYYNARLYIKQTDKDDGCFIRDAFDSLTRIGICREELWKYDVTKVFAQPDIFAYAEADSNKLNDFYFIENNSRKMDMIEQAIRSNHPVAFGTPVSHQFMETKYCSELPIFNFPQVSAGNHAMIITGVQYINSKRHFLVRNSWGSSWGKNGHCLMAEDYIGNSFTNDIWVPTLMKDLIT